MAKITIFKEKNMSLKSLNFTALLLFIFLAVSAFFITPAFAATTITYTDVATTKTVKPIRTRFTNNTDKPINLQHNNGTDTMIQSNATSDQISKKIISIKYGATVYYSANPNDYTIRANTTATVSKENANLQMTIPD
ncbi:MAG: hypothetical protein F6K21_19475 [Symploca sp. SIO2D2]|nr:hypothetical protein [Symploca sp. SIO2D2]